MSESYQAKRERWQRMLEALPADLRGHVSLRNVEAVASLTPKAQGRLAEAIQAGLKRLPRAVEQLRANPNTSVSDLLNPPSPTIQPEQTLSADLNKELADLIQSCYPDMPRVSAEALAQAEAMQIVRDLVQTIHHIFASPHLKADFVLVVLYAMMRQNTERLEEIISDVPACRQVFARSDLPYIPNEWSNQHAETNR